MTVLNQIDEKIGVIHKKAAEISDLVNFVKFQKKIGTITAEFSEAQKQEFISQGITSISDLIGTAGELKAILVGLKG